MWCMWCRRPAPTLPLCSHQRIVDRIRHYRCLHYEISSRRRTHLIFGANTDVGKTIVSGGLVRASVTSPAAAATATRYIKPLQCGGSDQAFVERYATHNVDWTSTRPFQAHTLFQWDTPLSPHTASILEDKPCSDAQILTALQSSLDGGVAMERHDRVVTYIETAGGVLSPASASPDNRQQRHVQTQTPNKESWGWTLQADLYQPLIGLAPVILVGDGRLGGISCTLTALESLVVRGYDIAAVIVLTDGTTSGASDIARPDTVSALRDYVSTRGYPLRAGSGDVLFSHPSQSIIALPPIPSDPTVPLYEWYESQPVSTAFAQLDQYLQQCWDGHVADLSSLVRSNDSNSAVWWPDAMDLSSQGRCLVDSAVGDHWHMIQADDTLDQLQARAVVDATASSWTRGVGHGESSLALAAAAAAGRYGHVSGQVRHAPAETLAQTLLSTVGASWAKRVFWTDGASVAVEAALRMGLSTYQKRMNLSANEIESTDWILCTQEDCYHGDTLGAMMAAEDYHDRTHPWYQAKSLCLATPTIGYRNGVLSISFPDGMQPTDDVTRTLASIPHAMDVVTRSVSPKLYSLYKEFIEMQWLVHEHRHQQKIGSVLLEPILQCVGGMKFVDPLWQRALMEQAASRNIPVIFDESTVGLYRLGVASCRSILKRDPDIAMYSKLLTSGLVPLSATLTTQDVWDACHDSESPQRLLNGNTLIANPVACVAALHALAAYDTRSQSRTSDKGSQSSLSVPQFWFDESYSKSLSELACVEQSFTLGTVLTVALHAENESRRTDQILGFLWGHGVQAHAIGNVVYLMVSPLTEPSECNQMASLLYEAIRNLES